MKQENCFEANNKFINGKSKWAHRMEGVGEKSGLEFILTSPVSVILVSSIILCRFGGHYVNRVRTGPGKPGKSWNFIMAFSRTGKSWKFVKLS